MGTNGKCGGVRRFPPRLDVATLRGLISDRVEPVPTVNRMPQRGIGLQPRRCGVGASAPALGHCPTNHQPQRGWGKGRARVKRRRNGRNRVAVGNDLRTVTRVARASQPVGFKPESRWDSPRAGTAKAGSGPGQGKGTHHPHLCQPNRVSHVSGSDRLGMTEPKISESAFTP